MRPDEHKKKKNSAYKKKHGINNNQASADNETAPDKKKREQQKKNKHPGPDDSATQSFSRQKNKTNKSSDNSDSSGSDSEVVERKAFRRREIVSNWKKYDLDPEGDEPVTSRGENFEKLLNMAGEAMSRFRFKDELEWEENVVGTGDGESVEGNPGACDFLSLDLADISSSMSCIPLHQLLGIDPSLFPVDQLESHIKAVTEQRNIYNYTIQQKEECSVSNSCDSSNKLPNSSNENESTPPVTKSTHQTKNKHKHSEVNEKCSNSSELGFKKISNKSDTNKQIKEHPIREMQDKSVTGVDSDGLSPEKVFSKPTSSEPSLDLQDDDLDQLLDIDERPQLTTRKEMGVSESSAATNGKSKEGLTVIKKDEKKEADELEDWLDSILD